jgi:hypothetical protein
MYKQRMPITGSENVRPGLRIQLGLRVNRQISAFREVLPQQAIGVLAGTPLTGVLRATEVHVDVRRQGKALVVSHLTATVPSQRLVEFSGQLVGLPDQGTDTVSVSLPPTLASS